jgi:hypothetical protein
LIRENIITKGIENLFPNELINRAIDYKKAFVDVTKVERTTRGIESKETNFQVNKDEKKNLCEWICKNGESSDFINFSIVFKLIREVL